MFGSVLVGARGRRESVLTIISGGQGAHVFDVPLPLVICSPCGHEVIQILSLRSNQHGPERILDPFRLRKLNDILGEGGDLPLHERRSKA
jgi:hypothetical protein